MQDHEGKDLGRLEDALHRHGILTRRRRFEWV